jgi:integrase
MVTGSVQTKKGKLYMVLRFKDAAGGWQTKWESTGLPEKGNKNKVKNEMLPARLVELNANGGYVELSKELLCDFIREWVKSRRGRLSPPTYMNYLHMIDKHICPYFKGKKLLLKDVTADSIKSYYDAKSLETDSNGKRKISDNTIIKHISLMRTAIQSAVGLPPKPLRLNPCDLVEKIDKPKRTKYRAEYYNAEEIRKLLSVAKGSSVEIPVFLASYFGLTRSECLGLRWDAIDLVRKVLTVRRKVVRALVDGKLINIDSDKLKTEARYRVLPLDDELLEYFSAVKLRQEQNWKLCGESYIAEYIDHVCVNDMGALLNPDYVSDVFSKLLKKHGLKHIRFHGLRHSCASLLLSLGYSMKDIQEWLGHSNYQTTANIYECVK